MVIEVQEALHSNVAIQNEEGKGHTIDSDRRENDADLRAGICEGCKTHAARGDETQHATFDMLTNVVHDGKGGPSDGSYGEGTAKDRSGLDCGSEVHLF